MMGVTRSTPGTRARSSAFRGSSEVALSRLVTPSCATTRSAGVVIQVSGHLDVDAGQKAVQQQDEHHRQGYAANAQAQAQLLLKQVAEGQVGHVITPSMAPPQPPGILAKQDECDGSDGH